MTGTLFSKILADLHQMLFVKCDVLGFCAVGVVKTEYLFARVVLGFCDQRVRFQAFQPFYELRSFRTSCILVS